MHTFCNHQQNDWAEWLPIVQYIMNSRPSSTTKKTPFELWMGHIPPAHQARHIADVPALEKREEELRTMRQDATKAMIEAQNSWIKLTNYQPYQKGEFVWLEGTNLHTTHPTRKLGSQRYGPFKILEVLGPVTFQIELPSQWKIYNVFHAKLLHPYKEMEQYGKNFQEPPPDLIDGKPKWEVEKILNIRT